MAWSDSPLMTTGRTQSERSDRRRRMVRSTDTGRLIRLYKNNMFNPKMTPARVADRMIVGSRFW